MPSLQSAGALGAVVERYSEIDRLQERVKSLLGEIEDVYRQIRRVASATKRGPGHPAAAATKNGPGRKPRAGRAPRGALKAAIYKVLAGGKAVRPADVVRALPKVGFRSASKPRVLYTSVYLSMSKDKKIQKTAEGFRLKE